MDTSKVFRLKPQEQALVKTGHHLADAFNCNRSPISITAPKSTKQN